MPILSPLVTKNQNMKRHLLLSAFLLAGFCLAGTSTVKAQGAYEQGKSYVNLGVGIAPVYGLGIPLGVSYEYGFTDRISAGIYADYDHFSDGYEGFNYGWTFFYFGVRGAYHFGEDLHLNNDKVDLYGGVALGYLSVSVTTPDGGYSNTAYASRLDLGLFVGGKYYFSSNIGAFAELGYGVSVLRLGLALKF